MNLNLYPPLAKGGGGIYQLTFVLISDRNFARRQLNESPKGTSQNENSPTAEMEA